MHVHKSLKEDTHRMFQCDKLIEDTAQGPYVTVWERQKNVIACIHED